MIVEKLTYFIISVDLETVMVLSVSGWKHI